MGKLFNEEENKYVDNIRAFEIARSAVFTAEHKNFTVTF
jgi:hypothetical protein